MCIRDRVSEGRKTNSKDEHVLISGQDAKHDIDVYKRQGPE